MISVVIALHKEVFMPDIIQEVTVNVPPARVFQNNQHAYPAETPSLRVQINARHTRAGSRSPGE